MPPVIDNNGTDSISNEVAIDNIKYVINKLDEILQETDVYTNVSPELIPYILIDIKNKLAEIKGGIELSSTLLYPTKQELTDVVWNTIVDITRYHTKGLKLFHKKIDMLLNKLVNKTDLCDDYDIVIKIKEEFDDNRKVNVSTIMYLNKLYKQLKETEN